MCALTILPEGADVSGIVAEVKEEDKTDYPLSECYRNMSGVGAALAIQGLQQGFIINNVIIYGIVAVVSKVNSSRLIKLEIDFQENTYKYIKSLGEYPLDLLLNAVISTLDEFYASLT